MELVTWLLRGILSMGIHVTNLSFKLMSKIHNMCGFKLLPNKHSKKYIHTSKEYRNTTEAVTHFLSSTITTSYAL